MTQNNNEEKTTIWNVLVGVALTAGALYAYFNGYVMAYRNFSLGQYSFLIAGIILGLFSLFAIYSFITEKKE